LVANIHMKKIDITRWGRKEHFDFFQNRARPCVCVSSIVNVENLIRYRKATKTRFSDCLYYSAMYASNLIREFRYRLVDRCPVEFQVVDAAFTYIPKGKELHSNCVAVYDDKFSIFSENIELVRNEADKISTLNPVGGESQGLIYLSCLSSIFFTSVTNPWGDPWIDTVPRIIFGKVVDNIMPISVELLHSFADGRHIASFLDCVQDILANPGSYLE